MSICNKRNVKLMFLWLNFIHLSSHFPQLAFCSANEKSLQLFFRDASCNFSATNFFQTLHSETSAAELPAQRFVSPAIESRDDRKRDKLPGTSLSAASGSVSKLHWLEIGRASCRERV
mgnify:CR=1 FL=1